MLVRMELDPAHTRFVFDFFEQYLKLDEEEEEALMVEMNQIDNAHQFTKLPNSWEERGIEKGIKQVAFEMLKEGLSMELIEKVTQLDKEQLKKLQKNYKR